VHERAKVDIIESLGRIGRIYIFVCRGEACLMEFWCLAVGGLSRAYIHELCGDSGRRGIFYCPLYRAEITWHSLLTVLWNGINVAFP
jgi:hypothetical protein